MVLGMRRFLTLGRFGTMLVAVLLMAGASATPSTAAGERVRFDDPAGDAIGGDSLDILAASVEVKPMAPRSTPSVVVTWELAAPPQPTAATYAFEGELEGCGKFSAAFRQGTVYNIVFGDTLGFGISTHQFYVGCGSPPDETGSTATFVDLMIRVDGNTIEMWTPLANLPEEARSGTVTGLRAYTQLSEPVTGIIGNGSLGLPPNDEATTERSFTY